MKRILLYFVLILCGINTTFAQVPTTERNALLALYNATNGPNWTNNINWNTANPVSTWHGITIGPDSLGNDHVVGIDLTSNNLNGTLPSLTNLYWFKSLKLGNNNLEGSIDLSPEQFITSIINTIQLNDNNISGLIIPDNFSNINDTMSVYINMHQTDI